MIARASNSFGYCKKEDVDEIVTMLTSYRLPTECPYGADQLAEIALSDKKRSGGKINLIVPFGVGNSQIHQINIEDLEAFFARGL